MITNPELVLESCKTPHRDDWHLPKLLLMVDVLHSTTLFHWKVLLYTLLDCVLDTDAYPQPLTMVPGQSDCVLDMDAYLQVCPQGKQNWTNVNHFLNNGYC